MKTVSELAFDAIKKLAPGYRGPFTLATAIGEGGAGLDSIGCLDLLLDLEAKTGLTLRDEHLTAECLASVGSLVAYLEQSKAG